MSASEEVPSLPGQQFHMDLGYIRGPSNLQAVLLERREEAKPKVIHSRQGFTCYLLVIDRCSRYMWVFPLKTRAVPTTLMQMFLSVHGNKEATPRIIRSDGEGALAESTEFRTFLVGTGYMLQKTAADTSSQNGMVERPHQSLGAMVRCMLYAAQLPAQFWADAIVYAVYISNRLYHSTIEQVLYNIWTGKTASLNHIRVFGSHVTVRKTGNRPTKLDSHHYTARFLRFGASSKNIICYDEVTKREKVARHCTLDEFHYGSKPADRPLMANELIRRLTMEVPTPLPGDIRDLSRFNPDSEEQRNSTSYTAAAATLYSQMTPKAREAELVLCLTMSCNAFTKPVQLTLRLNQHPTLGFILRNSSKAMETTILDCQEGTAVSRISQWRSRIKDAVVRKLHSTRIRTKEEFEKHVQQLRSQQVMQVTVEVAKYEVTDLPKEDMPQLHYDQLRHINMIHNAMKETAQGAMEAVISLTRAQLKHRPDYERWRRAEWAQHDKYKAQRMFSKPMPRPFGATVLPFVWDYQMKTDPITGEPIYKARGTCNGGKRYGKAVTLAETYTTCVAQPACRVYWSITASEGLLAFGADAGNAFAEAPPPVEPFYMRIDVQFLEWWVESEGNEPIPEDYVLLVQHALQGHPEAPRLWEIHIHAILVQHLKFVPTTHEKCLYSKRDANQNLIMLLRQVDDFAVSAKEAATCSAIIKEIGMHLQVPLNDLGLIKKFNGVNILQSRHFIKVSCEDYLQKILDSHSWQNLNASNLPIPMRSDTSHQRQLENAPRPQQEQEQQLIQHQAGFSYRMATGELIYALVTARPEISYATTKLTQYGTNPALIHYQAAKTVFAYLNNTIDDGLIYWRRRPRMDLPEHELPRPRSNPQDFLPRPCQQPHMPMAYTDSDWGSDSTHRRSFSGLIIMLAGAAVVYKTHYQRAVALSSTEEEFVAASDAGKMALYVRSLLQDLGFTQHHPTTLKMDNMGAHHMVKAGAPTKRTRHVDIRYFALLQWADSGQLTTEPIPTAHNISDSLTKATGRIKFHQHADIFMGRQPPSYVPHPLATIQSLRHDIVTNIASSDIQRLPTHIIRHLHHLDMEEVSALHHPMLYHAICTAKPTPVQSMGG